jgi:hypothetical protein
VTFRPDLDEDDLFVPRRPTTITSTARTKIQNANGSGGSARGVKTETRSPSGEVLHCTWKQDWTWEIIRDRKIKATKQALRAARQKANSSIKPAQDDVVTEKRKKHRDFLRRLKAKRSHGLPSH